MSESGSRSSACLICLKSVVQVKAEDWEHGHGSAAVNKGTHQDSAWFLNFCEHRLQVQLPPGLLNLSQTPNECGIEGSSGDDDTKQKHLCALTSLSFFCEDCKNLVTGLSKLCSELDSLEAKLLAKLNEMGMMIDNSKKLVSWNDVLSKMGFLPNVGDLEDLDQFRVDLMKKCNQKARKLFPKVVLTPVSLNSDLTPSYLGVNKVNLESSSITSSFKPDHIMVSENCENANEDFVEMGQHFDTISDAEWSPCDNDDDNSEPAGPGVAEKPAEVDAAQRTSKLKKQPKSINRNPPKSMKSSKNSKNLAQRRSHKRKGSSQCKVCNLKFRNEHRLVEHKRKSGHYITTGQYMKEFVKITGHVEKCPKCETGFTNPLDLYEHQVNRHKGGPDKLSFKCSSCPKMKMEFENCKYLLNHLMRIHEKNSPETENVTAPLFYCALCPLSFRASQTFELHKRFIHWNQSIYFCDDEDCPKGFKSPEEQYSHMTGGPAHGDKEVFQCDLCHMGYFSSYRLSLHKFIHAKATQGTRDMRYNCPVESCSKDSPRWDVIMSHHNSRHADINNTIAPPRCEICGESCISLPELESHIRWKHSEKDIHFQNITCEACDNAETYPTLRQYIVHSLTVDHQKLTEERKLLWRAGDESEDNFEGVDEHKVKVCPYPNCGRRFLSRQKLSRHKVRKHRRGPILQYDPVICEDCGKSFDVPSRLTSHKLEVHSEPQHECSECDKKFTTRGNLKVHIGRVHTERPIPSDPQHVCSECGKKFVTGSSLTQHWLCTHAERTIPCETCGKMFATKSMLGAHMKYHDKSYKCHICPAAFGSGSKLQDHLRKHAGIRLACEWCTVSFSDRCSFVKHMKNIHPDKYQEHLGANPSRGYRGVKRITVEECVAAGGTVKKSKSLVDYLDSCAKIDR